ncbi:MAG: glycerol-3-phosphate dehydrogenase, partial [Chloroflexi bacterium]|nr:glycerol-3-phosphate dehydrogenase [Chloroflexota bacterium]
YLHDHLPPAVRDHVHYAAVGGPSIAGELAARRDTSVVFVSRNAEILPKLQALFATPYYHIWTSTDMIGVEVAVALKNPFAMAVSLAAGMAEAEPEPDPAGAQMHNYAAAIFAQSLAEIAYLTEKMGGRPESVFSLPGAGDLYVTTQGGRNSRMGRLLGMGLAYQDAVEELSGETIEGADNVIKIVPVIDQLIAAGKLDADAVPLLRTLYAILTRNDRTIDFDRFFAKLPFSPPRPTGHPADQPDN